ncbi:hypothetical protein PHAVU_007G092200 [Phaseolus vulgaris]|uniref:EF-hand domain-containing protein n=1 Tax=Phaseolus vulgaris TaxID=3885 RepID=V7BDP7_PHAVU|nr:hypothetical protein PHAVU_007G092200g [Phaseolus vulgaris]ESW15670.1 hypothetical protein PHAVU_007G092200g [Phaseolus vulgaris]
MVSGSDPVESFFNSVQVVKESLSPLEVGFRKAAKDLEHCLAGPKNKVNGVCLIAPLREGSEFQICDVKKKKGLSMKVPLKAFWGMFSQNSGNGGGSNRAQVGKEDGPSCTNCLQFAVTWSLLVNGFLQSLPLPFKSGKKKCHKVCDEDTLCSSMKPTVSSCEVKQDESKGVQFGRVVWEKGVKRNDGKHVSLECVIGFILDQLSQTIQSLDHGVQENKDDLDSAKTCLPQPSFPHFGNVNALTGFLEEHKVYVNGFLGNLRFAKVGGVPSTVGGEESPSTNGEGDKSNNNSNNGNGSGNNENKDESGGNSPQKVANNIFSIPLSNVERLKSTLSTVSLAELAELLPQLGKTAKDHPDKKKLISVQDFFRYTESEGRRFFEELDRDGDGQVTIEDLEVAMRKRKLPRRYAKEFMSRARSHLFSRSFGLKQFLSLMEQKEPTILRAYTTLCLSKSGTLKKSEILESLKNAGLPANEDNAVAMMRFLKADTEESISYGHFRNFMLLLPSDRLQEDPRSIWFEAATVVAVPPAVEIRAGSVLRSALAGGLSCALSCALLHPVDTIKTRVQASSMSFAEIISKLPEIGRRGLYRGSIPAILGQFSSHGLRTGIFEASKLVLINFAPTLPELQVQSVASFCSTVLGTAVRIPCEVLKQRLQAGLFDNVGQAFVATWEQDGLRGFFRGTGATLCREVPFYVAGMGLYAESKKVVERLLERELSALETIAVGALSGGLAAVVTTPFDVMKTRMMTAQGRSVSMTLIAFSILKHEGPLGLFKGAVPRFFWIAPLGAMNFAGYELAKKAMNKNEEGKAGSSE